ncbi:MAG: DUF362 domain-containing protein [Candidatus Hodarchaeota archaeon]
MTFCKKRITRENENHLEISSNDRSQVFSLSLNKFSIRGLKNTSFFVFLLSFIWLIVRTGPKPSRIVYPCQRAAVDTLSLSLNAFTSLSISSIFIQIKSTFVQGSRIILPILLVVLISGDLFWSTQNPDQELQLTLDSQTATVAPASDIFVVNGRNAAHISELIKLMSSQNLFFYKSNTTGSTQGPDGLIAHNDVVLIKINSQWSERGGTNTDVLKEVVQAIVDHPDGFSGEIVVADNHQGWGGMSWAQNNAEDTGQSTQSIVILFSSTCNISSFDWNTIKTKEVNEYSDGDMANGYILYETADPETNLYVSYPKFRTTHGTYISFKHGIWNGAGYEKRLKVINLPVLKSHHTYTVTASVKHYMGVVSESMFGGLSNGHATVGRGGMGTLMVETGLPALNIIDAIWVNANPPGTSLVGPETPYSAATRINVLLAGTDPVALDYWAAKHVLTMTSELIGHRLSHSLNPDSGGGLGHWLNKSRDEMVNGGYNVTTDENRMNVYVYQNHTNVTTTTSTSYTTSFTPSSVSTFSSATTGTTSTTTEVTGFSIIFTVLSLTAIFILIQRRKRRPAQFNKQEK